MHDIKVFEADPEKVKANFAIRGLDGSLVDSALALNSMRKKLTRFVEDRRAQVKSESKIIGMLKKEGKDASLQMEHVASLKAEAATKEKQLEAKEHELQELLMSIPNIVHADVPKGKDEDDNIILKTWGEIPVYDFPAKEHVELGEALGMLDFGRSAKIVGSRFAVYRRDIAKLERVLINFMLEFHIAQDYEEILPPYLANAESLKGTGQLPKFEEDLFKIEGRDWYLIPTAEVPLTNLRREELFPLAELPMKFVAHTPCFRSEAGSYGRDTKGIIRQHQFNKVEMVAIVAPEESEKMHLDMIASAESILEALKLPYRSVVLCGGDIGFAAHKCIDIEVWLPGQNKYREISSVSNFNEFQARRAQIRFRNESGKPTFVHTLNGSGLAVGRTVVAIMENYQQEDGSIKIPDVLKKYFPNQEYISKK